MLNRSTRRGAPRRGAIAVMLALCLLGLLGVVAIAVDGGVLLDQHRTAQSVADAAAMSAAVDIYSNFPTNAGTDPKGSAKNSALNTAASLGYTNDGTRSTVTV